jgi:hypothetical protein
MHVCMRAGVYVCVDALGRYRDGIVLVLGWYWAVIGLVLEWYWAGIGLLLGWYWAGIGPVLGWYVCMHACLRASQYAHCMCG